MKTEMKINLVNIDFEEKPFKSMFAIEEGTKEEKELNELVFSIARILSYCDYHDAHVGKMVDFIQKLHWIKNTT